MAQPRSPISRVSPCQICSNCSKISSQVVLPSRIAARREGVKLGRKG
uniref:Uncharacterized protein n=1 Tax=Aegilops tauschii subsp. strangulata TaxID=200361 RepID=A0A452YG63_AEGTS